MSKSRRVGLILVILVILVSLASLASLAGGEEPCPGAQGEALKGRRCNS